MGLPPGGEMIPIEVSCSMPRFCEFQTTSVVRLEIVVYQNPRPAGMYNILLFVGSNCISAPAIYGAGPSDHASHGMSVATGCAASIGRGHVTPPSVDTSSRPTPSST